MATFGILWLLGFLFTQYPARSGRRGEIMWIRRFIIGLYTPIYSDDTYLLICSSKNYDRFLGPNFHQAYQFKSMKEAKEYLYNNIAKSEQHCWYIYRRVDHALN